MDQETGQDPARSAEAERLRRAVVLAQLHRRRRKRRWLGGLSALAAASVVLGGSVAAWSSQASAQSLASRIDTWHIEHDRAGCELEVRIVSAVGLQERAEDVLRAAEHVASAEVLLGESERAAFGERRQALLRTLDKGGFVTNDDRTLSRDWEARAAAAPDPSAFDVLAACLGDAAAVRPPLEEATPEQADALERELRALGDPREYDDARIDRLEAAVAQLAPAAIAIAQSRADLPVLEAALDLAPEQALASVRDADAHIRTQLAILTATSTPADVLDLVEALAMHVAAGWMAEAWQLDAMGEREAAAARAAAAESSRAAIADATPRPITDRGPTRPSPPRPPLSEPPAPPIAPGTSEPPPVAPGPPPSEQPPAEPPAPTQPADPPPVDPIEPPVEPGIDPGDPGIDPGDPGDPGIDPGDPGDPGIDPGTDPGPPALEG